MQNIFLTFSVGNIDGITILKEFHSEFWSEKQPATRTDDKFIDPSDACFCRSAVMPEPEGGWGRAVGGARPPD